MKVSNEKESQLSAWLTERVRYNDVPRMTDVWDYVEREKLGLTKRKVRSIMEEHNLFKMNRRQQRMPGRARMYRPIVVSDLGHWHADIGYFAINSRYETPISFRAGFLIAKDVLSRFVMATPLIKSKTTESVIKAFEKLFAVHEANHPDVAIKSISFDKERAVMSNKFQQFLKDRGIAFHAFDLTASKAKIAEGAIRLVREKMAVLMRRNRKEDRWWNLLPVVVDILNNQVIRIDGKSCGFTPAEVTKDTLLKFRSKLFAVAPAYYFAQFDIAPALVDFKYELGSYVRAKLIVTSSDVVGQKRSEQSVTDHMFVIENVVPYVTRNMKIGRAYRCRSLSTDQVEIFQEDEIVVTSRDGDEML